MKKKLFNNYKITVELEDIEEAFNLVKMLQREGYEVSISGGDYIICHKEDGE